MPSFPIDRSLGRSMVLSTGGLVASEHPLASQAGASILAAGGHAVDAAIAANAVMGVVSPMMCGIGGDLFAIVCEANGRLHGVNASGWAPAALTRDLLRSGGHASMPERGVHSVTVPGAVAGWSLLTSRFGRVPLSSALAPAIAMAEGGFPVTEIVAEDWRHQEDGLRQDPGAAAVFLRNGSAPGLGAVFANTDLAKTYRDIASGGRDAFYEGDTATLIVRGLEWRGGTMALDDLRAFHAEWTDPIATTYRGWQVFELPPNGAGVAALMMLNIMESFEMSRMGAGSADAIHLMIEAKKLAYADMKRHVADPRCADVPVAALLDRQRARDRADLIDLRRAKADVQPGVLPAHGGDTTYLCAVDRDGNMVSLIQSNYMSFGSGIVAEGTGFALQNRGALFALDPAHPNVLAPRKRPLHTIIPAFMIGGQTHMAFGIMGGWNQSQAHAQFVSNVVDHGLPLQAALEAPRFTKLTFEGVDVSVERRVSPDVRDALAARGHELTVHGDFCSLMGGGQAVMRTGAVNYGASDPRKDGGVVPEL